MVLAVAGCRGSNAAGTDAEGQPDSLVIVPVTRRDMVTNVESSGQIEPIRAIEIKSKASGAILRMPVETGDRVDAGALLAQIDTTEAATQVRQRSADLDYQRAQLTVMESRRQRAISLLAQGMMSQDQHDEAQLDYARVRSVFISTQAGLAEAQQRLAESTVRAPIQGTIIEKRVAQGQIISSATSGATEGTTLMKMADLSVVRVRALMGQADLGKIRPGQEATIVPDAYRNRKFTGQVIRIDPQSLTQRDVTYFPVLVDIDNREGLLLPGMDCAITISVSHLTNVLTVATDAVIALDEAEKIGPILKVPQDSIAAAIVKAGGKPTGVTKLPDTGEQVQTQRQRGVGRPVPSVGPIDAAIVFVVDTVRHHVRALPIRFGMQDWNLTEVRSGLRPGMTAVVPPSAAVVQQFEEFQRLMR